MNIDFANCLFSSALFEKIPEFIKVSIKQTVENGLLSLVWPMEDMERIDCRLISTKGSP